MPASVEQINAIKARIKALNAELDTALAVRSGESYDGVSITHRSPREIKVQIADESRRLRMIYYPNANTISL